MAPHPASRARHYCWHELFGRGRSGASRGIAVAPPVFRLARSSVAPSRRGARGPGRRARAGVREARGQTACGAGARAARGDAGHRVPAARTRLSRSRRARDPALRDAATVWIADDSSSTRTTPALPTRSRSWRVRSRLPSDRSFADLRPGARARHGPAAAGRHRDSSGSQAMLDVLFEYPIQSDRVDVLHRPELARLGAARRDRAALPAAGRRGARLRATRRPRAGAARPALAPGGAALRRAGLRAHPRRHRPPALPRLPRHPVPPPPPARRSSSPRSRSRTR